MFPGDRAATQSARGRIDRPADGGLNAWIGLEELLFSVAAWREAPYFTDAERAALALTEVATRLSDRADPVPDEIWAEAARHYDEPALANLVLNIGLIDLWNRLNVTTRQVAGSDLRWER